MADGDDSYSDDAHSVSSSSSTSSSSSSSSSTSKNSNKLFDMDAAAAESHNSTTRSTADGAGNVAKSGGGGGGFLEALYARNALEFKVIETIGTSNESIQARKMRIQLEDMKWEIAANDAAITKLTSHEQDGEHDRRRGGGHGGRGSTSTPIGSKRPRGGAANTLARTARTLRGAFVLHCDDDDWDFSLLEDDDAETDDDIYGDDEKLEPLEMSMLERSTLSARGGTSPNDESGGGITFGGGMLTDLLKKHPELQEETFARVAARGGGASPQADCLAGSRLSVTSDANSPTSMPLRKSSPSPSPRGGTNLFTKTYRRTAFQHKQGAAGANSEQSPACALTYNDEIAVSASPANTTTVATKSNSSLQALMVSEATGRLYIQTTLLLIVRAYAIKFGVITDEIALWEDLCAQIVEGEEHAKYEEKTRLEAAEGQWSEPQLEEITSKFEAKEQISREKHVLSAWEDEQRALHVHHFIGLEMATRRSIMREILSFRANIMRSWKRLLIATFEEEIRRAMLDEKQCAAWNAMHGITYVLDVDFKRAADALERPDTRGGSKVRPGARAAPSGSSPRRPQKLAPHPPPIPPATPRYKKPPSPYGTTRPAGGRGGGAASSRTTTAGSSTKPGGVGRGSSRSATSGGRSALSSRGGGDGAWGEFNCADPASSRRYREALDFALDKRFEISEVQRWKSVEAQLRAVDAQFASQRSVRTPITAVKTPRPQFNNTSATVGLHNVGMGGAFKSVDPPYRRGGKNSGNKSGTQSGAATRSNSSTMASLDPFALSAQGSPLGAPKKQPIGKGSETAQKKAALSTMKKQIEQQDQQQSPSPGRSYSSDSAPSSPMATSEQSPQHKRASSASSSSSSSSSSSGDTKKAHSRKASIVAASKRSVSSSSASSSSSSSSSSTSHHSD